MLTQAWIRDIAYSMTSALIADFFELWSAIDGVHLNLDDLREDEILWTLETSGQYSASSAYEIQFAGQIASNFPKLIWKAWAPPQCKQFLWLLLQNKVWMAARLQLGGWDNNYFCALCERNLETATHLFIECPFSRSVWNLVATWAACPSLNPEGWTVSEDMEDWFLLITERGNKRSHTLSILTLWSLWKQRNAVVFRMSRRSVQQLFSEIKDTCAFWIAAGGKVLALPSSSSARE